MSSVKWKTVSHKKDRVTGVNLLKHCDQKFRQDLNRQHHNKDIDPARSYLNQNFTGMTLDESRAFWMKRVGEIEEDMERTPDSSGRHRKLRPDITEMVSLEMAAPPGMTDDEARKFFQDFYELCVKKYGKENIISANSHFDEIHEYQDAQDGEMKISRPHIHIQVIPETDGRLGSKAFCSLKNIKDLDREVDGMCWNKYHIRFHTGEELKKKDVERLKSESEYVENLSRQKEELEIKIGGLINYLSNIKISDKLTAYEDYETGGKGDAVNRASDSRNRKEIQKKDDRISQLESQVSSLKDYLLTLDKKVKTYEERAECIKHGIATSDDPESVRKNLSDILGSLEEAGRADIDRERTADRVQ